MISYYAAECNSVLEDINKLKITIISRRRAELTKAFAVKIVRFKDKDSWIFH